MSGTKPNEIWGEPEPTWSGRRFGANKMRESRAALSSIDLRRTESKTEALSGEYTMAWCSASQAHVTPLSAAVGRNRMVEVEVVRPEASLSLLSSARDSAK